MLSIRKKKVLYFLATLRHFAYIGNNIDVTEPFLNAYQHETDVILMAIWNAGKFYWGTKFQIKWTLNLFEKEI